MQSRRYFFPCQSYVRVSYCALQHGIRRCCSVARETVPLPFLGVSSLIDFGRALSARPFFWDNRRVATILLSMSGYPGHIAALAAALVLAAGCAASGGTARAPDEQPMSCAELAEQRATEQYDDDTASAESRQGGAIQGSALRQQLREMDASARREAVYDECIRLRNRPTPTENAETTE